MKRILSSQGLLVVQGVGLAALIGVSAKCSSNSGNVVVPSSGSSSGDNTSGSSGDNTSGSSGDGTSGSSGTTSTGSSSGSTPFMGDGGTCMSETSTTLGVHIRLNVTWAATNVLVASTGKPVADIYLLSTETYTTNSDGSLAIAGTTKTCGLNLPPIQLSGVVNNEKVNLVFNNLDIWDGPKMPTFTTNGTQGGFSVGSSISIPPAVGILGLSKTSSFANLSTAWPAPSQQDTTAGTWPQFMSSNLSDDDGDGNPGITIDSSNTSPYSYVPASLGYSVAYADQVYIVSRNEIGLTGTVTSCGHSAGTAQVKYFENHVVGCHDGPNSTGPNCEQTSGIIVGGGFIDANRTIYVPGTATYTAVEIPAGSTCATARAMSGAGM